MIKIDGGNTHIKGSPEVIMSELAAMTNHVLQNIHERTGTPVEKVETDIEKLRRVYILVDSGMAVSEAVEIAGLDGKVTGVQMNKNVKSFSEEQFKEFGEPDENDIRQFKET